MANVFQDFECSYNTDKFVQILRSFRYLETDIHEISFSKPKVAKISRNFIPNHYEPRFFVVLGHLYDGSAGILAGETGTRTTTAVDSIAGRAVENTAFHSNAN